MTNLEQTIAELEKRAARYREAAGALRALQDGGNVPAESPETAMAAQRGRLAKGSTGADNTKNKATKKSGPSKRVVSAETRAKLAASMKARHQQKREEQAAAPE